MTLEDRFRAYGLALLIDSGGPMFQVMTDEEDRSRLLFHTERRSEVERWFEGFEAGWELSRE